MKKIPFISIIAGLTALWFSAFKPIPAEPVYTLSMLKCKGVYLTCSDSVTPGCTGCTMTGQRNESGGTSTYQFNATSSSMTFACKFKDPTAGNIAPGDSIYPTSVTYKICGTQYKIRLDATPIVNISGDTVRIDYTDCILPLNGTSGSVVIQFIQ